jgi:thiamine pyrophosphate-dependent acetolactate synthase large subunit-like protein
VRPGAHVLLESLLANGIDTVFGIPGVDTLAVYDAFLDHPELRSINVRHEQAAVFMADGYHRSSGRIGAALTSGGPGALNTVTAMSTAFTDSSAVLHVMNENPPGVRRKAKGYFHDLADQHGIFRPVTGYASQVLLAAEIPGAIGGAVQALSSRRPRPAIVEIASEAISEPTDVEVGRPPDSARRRPDPGAVRRVAEVIAHARRPVVWSGGGVIASGASEEVLRLAERLGAPVITSQAGKGSIPATHPLHVGNWSNEAPVRDLLAASDVLVAIGTRFSYFPTGGWTLQLPDTIVQIDIDAEEIGRNYRTTAGIVSDAGAALRELIGVLEEMGVAERPGREGEVREALAAVSRAVGRSPELDVLDQMRAALPASARVFNDPTTIAFWARSAWLAEEPRTWFVPSGFGTLGFALPAAIGAKVATPEHVSVAVIGDAGVMFTIQDLMTAVEHDIAVVVMVFNDEGYGVERRHQDHLYGRRSGVDLKPPDFVALARAFGAEGLRVDDLSRVGSTLERAVAHERPVLIEIPNRFNHPGYGAWAAYD